MIKKIALASVVAASLASTSVMANEAKTGVVVGLYGGYGMPVNGWLKDLSEGDFKKKSGSPIAGGLLGFDFALNPMFSVGAEINAQYLFNQKYDVVANNQGVTGDAKVKMYSGILFLTGKFYIPETGGLNLFAKAGYGYNKLKLKTNTNISVVDPNQKDIDESKTLYRPVIAGGVGYNIENINIFLEGQYNFLPYQGENGGYGAAFVGASYTFPM